MTQLQLDRSVARATGESLATIHRRGFSLLSEAPGDLDANDPLLGVDCPLCGRVVALASGSCEQPILAGCARCEVEFAFEPDEVHLADAREVDPLDDAA